ncbi:MAG: 16S rRNA (uracil(1498)-N(3))-methyltransferase [Haliea sp.]|nr:16S rRNA (uracil(1498)-N(3))-methyltransferase [Haliea sp.]|tara:strand:- start:21541 stop:22254 length:714 start_codon:yes stop_codon:yes gene_type:complete
MNVLLFQPGACNDAGQLRVTGRQLQHLREVHRASPGDSLRVGEINGQLGSAEILALEDDHALLQVTLDQPPPLRLPVVLVVALPRPKMLRRLLRSAAEFGVEELHLIHSYRVEKSYWQTPVLQQDTVRDYFLQGAEQARDTRLPHLSLHRRFRPFVEDRLPGLIAGREGLLAHPGEAPPCPTGGDSRPRLLMVGPEGGFIAWEVEKLLAAGCRQVSLGPRILRVENAVSVLLGRLLN